MDPTYIEAYIALSNLLQTSHNQKMEIKADSLLRFAYKIAPNNQNVYNALKKFYTKINDFHNLKRLKQNLPLLPVYQNIQYF